MPNWISTSISGAELTAFNADHPVMLGINYFRYGSEYKWLASPGSLAGTASNGADPFYGHDNYTHLQTFPGSAQNEWHYAVNLGTNRATIDSFALLNWTVTTGTVTQIELQIADNAAFSSELITIISINSGISGTTRLVKFGTTRYSNIAFMRVKFTGTAFVIKVGEFWAGQRRQMKSEPLVPFDYDSTKNDLDEFRSNSGVISRYVNYKGQRVLNARFTPHETFFYNEALNLWDVDTEFGSLPFLWVQKPISNPRDAPMMLFSKRTFDMPYVGVHERDFVVQAEEQGPYFARAEV